MQNVSKSRVKGAKNKKLQNLPPPHNLYFGGICVCVPTIVYRQQFVENLHKYRAKLSRRLPLVNTSKYTNHLQPLLWAVVFVCNKKGQSHAPLPFKIVLLKQYCFADNVGLLYANHLAKTQIIWQNSPKTKTVHKKNN